MCVGNMSLSGFKKMKEKPLMNGFKLIELTGSYRLIPAKHTKEVKWKRTKSLILDAFKWLISSASIQQHCWVKVMILLIWKEMKFLNGECLLEFLFGFGILLIMSLKIKLDSSNVKCYVHLICTLHSWGIE